MTVEPTYRVLPDARVIVSHRFCSGPCRQLLPPSAFYWNGDRRASACKRCVGLRVSDRLRGRGVCVTCGGPRFDPDVPGECSRCYRESAPWRQAVKAARLRWLGEQFEEARDRQRQRRAAWVARGRHPGRKPKSMKWSVSDVDRHRIWREFSSFHPVVPRALAPEQQANVYERLIAMTGPDSVFITAPEIAGEALLAILNGEASVTDLGGAITKALLRVRRFERNLGVYSLDNEVTKAFDGAMSWADALADTTEVYVEDSEDAC